MTLTEICEGLEKSQELAKAGFPQGKSYAVWWENPITKKILLLPRQFEVVGGKIVCDAPTLAEILGELPTVIYTNAEDDNSDHYLVIEIDEFTKQISCDYHGQFDDTWWAFDHPSPADLYIRLAKEGLIPDRGKETR